ncbi:MAG: signal peptidase II [Patescibacteria group bacterium]|nr:signal peptidase II [Patescibacteria group bacterium]
MISRHWPRLLGYAAAFGFLLDRLLKALTLAYPAPHGWVGVAEFTLFLNRGIAFSIGLPKPIFWLAVVGAAAVVLAAFVQAFRQKQKLSAAFLIVVMAGAASNLIDRILYSATIDYLLFFGVSAVNLADGLIIAGLIGWAWQQRATPTNAAATKLHETPGNNL